MPIKFKTRFRVDFYRGLYVALPILAIALILVGVMSMLTLKSVDKDRQLVTERYSRALAITNHLRYLQSEQTAMVLRYLLSGDAPTFDQVLSLRAEFKSISEKMDAIVSDPETSLRLRTIADLQEKLYAETTPIIALRGQGFSVDDVRARFQTVPQTRYQALDAALADLFKFELERFGKMRDRTDRSIHHLTNEVLLVAILALAVFILIGAALVRLARTQRALEKDKEKLLQHSQVVSQARKEVLETVAHDLKNPLGSVKMSLDLALESSGETVESIRDLLEVGGRSAQAMERLVGDLLDHAKIESGQLQLNKEVTDLRPFVADLVKRFAVLSSRNDIKLSSQFANRPFPVEIDAGRMDQLLSNILGNAIKFTPKGGRVAVAVGCRDRKAIVSVKDDGPGMDSVALAHVFDRYWQVRKTAAQGTGLGLAIAKAIAEAHSGRIWAESRVGQGSTFYIELPLADEEAWTSDEITFSYKTTAESNQPRRNTSQTI